MVLFPQVASFSLVSANNASHEIARLVPDPHLPGRPRRHNMVSDGYHIAHDQYLILCV
jgi:hypothetical protein